MEAGLVEKWHAVYGDLNLWDFFAMNEYLDYKSAVEEKIENWHAHKKALKKQKIH